VNVLKSHLRVTVETLLRAGVSRREITRRVGVDRKTIRRYAEQMSKSPGETPKVATGSEGKETQNPPPWPPAFSPRSVSACHRPVPPHPIQKRQLAAGHSVP
jgi:hypothetical protein